MGKKGLHVSYRQPELDERELTYAVQAVGSMTQPAGLACDGTAHLFVDLYSVGQPQVDDWCSDFENMLQLFEKCINDAAMF